MAAAGDLRAVRARRLVALAARRQHRPWAGDRRRRGQGAPRHHRRAQRPGQDGIRREAAGNLTAKPQRGQIRRLARSPRIEAVTLVLPAEQTRSSAPKRPRSAIARSLERVGFGVLLVATAVLYLWNLSASGWANTFYSAAAQAGASNWTAMLFGSSDAANAITVDKTPAALWIIDISVRLFGLNPWSVLVPQALEGVAAVAPALRRRPPGQRTGCGAAGRRGVRADAGRRADVPVQQSRRAAGADAGRRRVLRAARVRKGQQPLVVGRGGCRGGIRLPGQDAAGVPGAAGIRRRLSGRRATARCGGGWPACSARRSRPWWCPAGWYLLLVELWPSVAAAVHRRLAARQHHRTGVGLQRVRPADRGTSPADWATEPRRRLGPVVRARRMGAEIAWLLPAAVICLVAGLVITRRAPRTDPTRAALILWGGWLVVTAVVFSFMNGIVHSYYTVALAPAIAACIGIGATLLWQNRFDVRAATALSGAVSGHHDPGGCAAVAARRVAALAAGGRRRRGSGRGGAAAGRRAAVAAGRPRGGGPGRRGVSGRADGVFRCDGADSAQRRDTVGGTVAPRRTRRFGGPGGLLASPHPGPALSATLAADADDFTWAAAVIGSNNAAGYQLASVRRSWRSADSTAPTRRPPSKSSSATSPTSRSTTSSAGE